MLWFIQQFRKRVPLKQMVNAGGCMVAVCGPEIVFITVLYSCKKKTKKNTHLLLMATDGLDLTLFSSGSLFIGWFAVWSE